MLDQISVSTQDPLGFFVFFDVLGANAEILPSILAGFTAWRPYRLHPDFDPIDQALCPEIRLSPKAVAISTESNDIVRAHDGPLTLIDLCAILTAAYILQVPECRLTETTMPQEYPLPTIIRDLARLERMSVEDQEFAKLAEEIEPSCNALPQRWASVILATENQKDESPQDIFKRGIQACFS